MRTENLAGSPARKVIGTTTRANVIGKIESLLIAQAPAMRTSLVGKTLLQSILRETIGINVVAYGNAGGFKYPPLKRSSIPVHPIASANIMS